MLVETRTKQKKEFKMYISQLNKTKRSIEDNEVLHNIQNRLKQISILLEENEKDFSKIKLYEVKQNYISEDFIKAEDLIEKILISKNINSLEFYIRRHTEFIYYKIAISYYLRNKNYTLEMIADLLKCHHSSVVNLLKKDLKYYPEVVKIINEIDKINNEVNNE